MLHAGTVDDARFGARDGVALGARTALRRILSGGQTGADRAALDVAIARGLDYGGWCPKGGWAEDAPNPPGVLAHYPNLRETPDADPRTRTEWNVRDSDATLAFMPANALSPGTAFTIESAKRSRKPVLVVDPFAANAADGMRAFVAAHPAVRTLNIAGPRESESPGVYAAVYSILTEFVMVGE